MINKTILVFLALLTLLAMSVSASTFESRGFTIESYSARFNKPIPAGENAFEHFEHQANLMCEWKRVYPETKWYLGVWNRKHTVCLALGDRNKLPLCTELYGEEFVCEHKRTNCIC